MHADLLQSCQSASQLKARKQQQTATARPKPVPTEEAFTDSAEVKVQAARVDTESRQTECKFIVV